MTEVCCQVERPRGREIQATVVQQDKRPTTWLCVQAGATSLEVRCRSRPPRPTQAVADLRARCFRDAPADPLNADLCACRIRNLKAGDVWMQTHGGHMYGTFTLRPRQPSAPVHGKLPGARPKEVTAP
jgi:hypothetical protein